MSTKDLYKNVHKSLRKNNSTVDFNKTQISKLSYTHAAEYHSAIKTE